MSEVSPEEFWQLLQEIAGRDKNAVVLQGVGESLWRVTGRNEERAAAVLAILAPRVLDGPDHSELARMFMALTMWLCIVQKHPWAVSLSAQLLNEPVTYSKSLSRATTAALPFVKPSKAADKRKTKPSSTPSSGSSKPWGRRNRTLGDQQGEQPSDGREG